MYSMNRKLIVFEYSRCSEPNTTIHSRISQRFGNSLVFPNTRKVCKMKLLSGVLRARGTCPQGHGTGSGDSSMMSGSMLGSSGTVASTKGIPGEIPEETVVSTGEIPEETPARTRPPSRLHLLRPTTTDHNGASTSDASPKPRGAALPDP